MQSDGVRAILLDECMHRPAFVPVAKSGGTYSMEHKDLHPLPKSRKSWVSLANLCFTLEISQALVCGHTRPREGPLPPAAPALCNSQPAELGTLAPGGQEKYGPHKKWVFRSTLNGESWDPGPAPIDSASKVMSKTVLGLMMKFCTQREI